MVLDTSIASPHDRVFRASMGNLNVARDYFLKNLPEKILEVTDLDTLQLCPQTYVDEELKLSQSDVLYRVKIAEKDAYLYLLCEHQSKPDRLMPYRIIKYEVNIWAEHLKQFGGHTLPLIVSTVFYNGQEPYRYSKDFRDLLDAPKDLIETVWRQPFKLIDAHDITDEDLRKHKWFGVLGFFMAHIFTREFLPYLHQAMATLKEIEEQDGSDYVITLLNYVLTTSATNVIDGFVDTVKQGLSATTGEMMTTIAEQFMERGKLNGERAVLKRQLSKRFGSIPMTYLNKLENASAELLLELADRIVDAKTVEDVFVIHH